VVLVELAVEDEVVMDKLLALALAELLDKMELPTQVAAAAEGQTKAVFLVIQAVQA
jgi:hypothetical protein